MNNVRILDGGKVVTLDEVWAKAESLGLVKVNDSLLASKTDCHVVIKFERASGTAIYAKGRGEDVLTAMLRAIDEAWSLGARP